MAHLLYDREGTQLVERGLYVDEAQWQYHVFDVSTHQSDGR
jgi:hypothetical protein